MPDQNSEYIQQLAQKLLLGTITEAEKTTLENWYNDKPLQTPVWELRDEHKQALEHRLYAGIGKQIKPVRRLAPVWIKLSAAASVIIVSSLLLTLYLSTWHKHAEANYSVASTEGHIKKILLPDHSIVWLKGNSRLEYPGKFSDSTRNVTLHGEALFEVSKDHRHPFIIQAGNYLTRVVGTSFNIKEDQQSSSFKLTVLTGKVLVAPVPSGMVAAISARAVMVTPGKEFESLNISKPSVISTTPTAVKTAVVQGTEYMMNFENTGFGEVKARIERKFDVQISVDENTYRNCELSANVTDQSLINTLKVICAAIGADYSIQNNKIIITGGGCK